MTQVGEVHVQNSEDNVKECFSSTVGSRGWAPLTVSPAQITLMSYWDNCAKRPFLNQLAAQDWHCKFGFRVLTLSIPELGGGAENSWLPVLGTCCVDWQQLSDKNGVMTNALGGLMIWEHNPSWWGSCGGRSWGQLTMLHPQSGGRN